MQPAPLCIFFYVQQCCFKNTVLHKCLQPANMAAVRYHYMIKLFSFYIFCPFLYWISTKKPINSKFLVSVSRKIRLVRMVVSGDCYCFTDQPHSKPPNMYSVPNWATSSEVGPQRVRFQTFLLIIFSHFCFACNYDILERRMSSSSLYPKISSS